MYLLMRIQYRCSYKLFLANITLIRSFSCVIPHMNRQSTLLSETSAACFAPVRLLFRMDQSMRSQQRFGSKTFPAIMANIRLLSGMHPHMIR